MSELLFEYKVRYRYKTGYKEFSFYATTEIEEFLNRNNIKYVRNETDTVEHRLFKEIERLKEQLNDEIEEELKQSEIMVKKQQEIERLKGALQTHEILLQSNTKEIERLNNIINKIENFIEDRIDNYKYYECYETAHALETIRNDIKELKGSDK